MFLSLGFMFLGLGYFWDVFPQIAGSYRGSNFSKGGIVFANWPTSGCCSKCCCDSCPGYSESCLPFGGVGVNLLSRVLSGVLRIIVCHWAVSGCQVLFRVLRIMCGVRVLSRVLCRGSCQGAPDYVCYWGVGSCPKACLPLGVRVPSRVLFRVLRIMFAIGRCQGAVQGAPDHVCHGVVSGCCPGC